MNKIHGYARTAFTLCLLLSICILPGCALPTAPTPWPTRTPRPTLTFTPAPSATASPVPTTTPVVAVASGTQVPESGIVLDETNLSSLTLLAQWGLGKPQQVRWSPDGARIAVAATGGLALYRAADLSLERVIRPGVALRALAFSPDGAELAAGTEAGTILRWNPADGSALPSLSGIPAPVLSLAYSPDSARLAAGAWDNRARVWKLSAPAEPVTFDPQLAPIRTIAFSADGSELFTWNRIDQMLTAQVDTAKAGREVYTGANTPASSAAYSSGVDAIAVEQDTRVRVTRTTDSTILFQIPAGFAKPIQSVALASDAQTVATLEEGALRLWEGPRPLAVFDLTAAPSAPMDFAPDGAALALVSDRLNVYPVSADSAASAQKTAQPRTAPLPDYQPGSPLLSLLADDTLVTAQDGSAGKFVTLQTRALSGSGEPARLSLSGGPANTLALSPDRKTAALGGLDGTLTLVNAASGDVLRALKAHRKPVTAIAFAPAGPLATGASDGSITLWDPATGSAVLKINANAKPGELKPVSRLLFSPDGKWLAAGAGGNTWIYDAAAGTLAQTLNGTSAVFSPSGDRLALSTQQETHPALTFYSVPGFKAEHTFAVQGSRFAFTPDGALLAVSGPDLAFYSVEKGILVRSFSSPAPHGRVSIAPHGDRVVLTAWDGVTSILGIPPGF